MVQLKEISLPNSIRYIGNNAFDECDSLEYITFPSGLTYIGDSAFDHTGLSSVNIPDSVIYIGDYAFAFCNLEELELGKGVKQLKHYAFGGCDKLKSVLLPANLQSIGSQSFYGCESLETITIPETVESFGEEAFRDCDSLKSVYIADLESWCNVEFSDYKANPLSNEGELYINGELAEKILITDNITTIGKYTFGGCTSISNVILGNGVSVIDKGAFSNCLLYEITIGSGLSTVEINAFSGCDNLLSVYYVKNKSDWENISIESGNDQLIKASKYYIGPDGGKCGDNLVWNYADGLLTISGTGTMYDYKGTSEDPVPWESKQNIIERVVISEGVTSIGKNAFEHCDRIKRMIIPSSVTKIGGGAFSHCSSLEKISIPSGVTEIEDFTFTGCGSLKEIRMPISVTRFGAMSFMPGCDINMNVYYQGTQENWRKIEDRSGFFDMGFGNIHYSSDTNITLSKYITDKNYKYTSVLFSYISPYSVIMYGKIDGYYDNMGIKYALLKDGKQVGTMELPFMGTPASDGAFAIRVMGKAIVPGTYTAVPYYQINSDVTESQELIVTVTE